MRRQLVLLIALPSLAMAHGGLPISQAIIPRDGQLVVPTRFWGVFLGSEERPWRWICEEAINRQQARKWALTGDGTYHVTDYLGMTSSRDSGCTWVPSTGEIALRPTSWVVADPAVPGRAFATTDAGVLLPGAAEACRTPASTTALRPCRDEITDGVTSQEMWPTLSSRRERGG